MHITRKRLLSLASSLLLLGLAACNSDESPAKDSAKPASATATAASAATSSGNQPQPPALHCAP
ncbi:hypothetical protein EV682_11494 [Iodobacter fluviatilis]|uniref:Uncharacterized protein n=2 Tax=Iodobacter fluviatilis TaxID=537 RepID=A0A377Q5C2_9NEIS|nr:hypothetical protein EV682_11494 [Iodobacter fluviatilis]STQ89799.1 Uncharacterised protein [Iodobacter fluviatilis]